MAKKRQTDKWSLKRDLKLLEKWVPGQKGFQIDSSIEELKKILIGEEVEYPLMAIAGRFQLMASWHGCSGCLRVLKGDADGWREIQGALRFWTSSARIMVRARQLIGQGAFLRTRAVLCLAHAIAVRDDSLLMRITIRYQLRNETAPVELGIAPEDYFDPLGSGENYAEHGDPRHQLTHEYLGIPPSDLEWVECERIGTMGDTVLRIQYFQNGEGWMSFLHGRPDEPELMLITLRVDPNREIGTRVWRKHSQDAWTVQHVYEYEYAEGRIVKATNISG